ncbi:helicase [Seminavis robusta]|uniref:Helicase n=1 Tax=Seminavis robusta TaxID=568900 RepID=A0A9N8EA59_9STRA|nr:helicase [Seminavis robusta]|eukprot:Sro870_g213660.1 helicase (1247) ;mRNA; r:12905-16724
MARKTLTSNDVKKLSWDDYFKRLVEFHQKHGHTNVPFRYDKEGLALWVYRQRHHAVESRPLSSVQRQKLVDLGGVLDDVQTEWDKTNHMWIDSYMQMLEYREANGDFLIRSSKRPLLRKWVTKQRHRQRRNLLDETRAKLLKDAGFSWDQDEEYVKHVNPRGWEENFQLLFEYWERFGTSDVPLDYMEDSNLAYWVHELKGHPENLTNKQKKQLKSLNFSFGLMATATAPATSTASPLTVPTATAAPPKKVKAATAAPKTIRKEHVPVKEGSPMPVKNTPPIKRASVAVAAKSVQMESLNEDSVVPDEDLPVKGSGIIAYGAKRVAVAKKTQVATKAKNVTGGGAKPKERTVAIAKKIAVKSNEKTPAVTPKEFRNPTKHSGTSRSPTSKSVPMPPRGSSRRPSVSIPARYREEQPEGPQLLKSNRGPKKMPAEDMARNAKAAVKPQTDVQLIPVWKAQTATGTVNSSYLQGLDELWEDVGPDDVVMGRGGKSNHHEGNARYRGIIELHRAAYKLAPKLTKRNIARDIVRRINQNGGRFLRLNKGGSVWSEITFEEAAAKTSQSLREVHNYKILPSGTTSVEEQLSGNESMADGPQTYQQSAVPPPGGGPIILPKPDTHSRARTAQKTSSEEQMSSLVPAAIEVIQQLPPYTKAQLQHYVPHEHPQPPAQLPLQAQPHPYHSQPHPAAAVYQVPHYGFVIPHNNVQPMTGSFQVNGQHTVVRTEKKSTLPSAQASAMVSNVGPMTETTMKFTQNVGAGGSTKSTPRHGTQAHANTQIELASNFSKAEANAAQASVNVEQVSEQDAGAASAPPPVPAPGNGRVQPHQKFQKMAQAPQKVLQLGRPAKLTKAAPLSQMGITLSKEYSLQQMQAPRRRTSHAPEAHAKKNLTLSQAPRKHMRAMPKLSTKKPIQMTAATKGAPPNNTVTRPMVAATKANSTAKHPIQPATAGKKGGQPIAPIKPTHPATSLRQGPRPTIHTRKLPTQRVPATIAGAESVIPQSTQPVSATKNGGTSRKNLHLELHLELQEQNVSKQSHPKNHQQIVGAVYYPTGTTAGTTAEGTVAGSAAVNEPFVWNIYHPHTDRCNVYGWNMPYPPPPPITFETRKAEDGPLPWEYPSAKEYTSPLLPKSSVRRSPLAPSQIYRGANIDDGVWVESYEKMVQFMLKHGQCLRGPGDGEEDDRALVEWATLQRKLYNEHKLEPVRKKLLDQIGFEWRHSKKRSRGDEEADDDGDDQASVGSSDSYMVI